MSSNRVSKLRKAVQDQGLDAILITSGINRRYLSGFTGSSGYVLITEDEGYLLTDFRYMTQASDQTKGLKVVQHGPNFIDTVRELLPKGDKTRLGFEQDDVAYGAYASYAEALKPAELVPVSQAVEKLRMYKDEEELAVLQRAAKLADDTFVHIQKIIKPGMTERDVDLEMEFFMRSHGATASSFDTIVASGERSAMPHGVASSKVIQKGDMVTLDFGALLDGYCSDITRTIAVGDPGTKLKEIYDIVLESQLYALEHIKPGMTGREADALARDIIAARGYGDAFGHSLGHGLGMEVHEWPRLSMRSDDVLEPGMVVTVEPGIYVPGLGGVRIEDDVVVTETGVEKLTRSSKDYVVL